MHPVYGFLLLTLKSVSNFQQSFFAICYCITFSMTCCLLGISPPIPPKVNMCCGLAVRLVKWCGFTGLTLPLLQKLASLDKFHDRLSEKVDNRAKPLEAWESLTTICWLYSEIVTRHNEEEERNFEKANFQINIDSRTMMRRQGKAITACYNKGTIPLFLNLSSSVFRKENKISQILLVI